MGFLHVIPTFPDLVCWSKFGYRRLAKLLCVAIQAETEKPQLQKNLCLRLLTVISRSGGDPTIVPKTQRNLLMVGSTTNETMMDVLQTLAQDNLIAWAIVSPSLGRWETFVKLSLNGDSMASSMDMRLVSSCLVTMDVSAWESIVGPAVITKLKSKPESVLDMVVGLTQSLPKDVIEVITEEFISVIMKQIKSANDTVRNLASTILTNLGQRAIQLATTKTVVNGGIIPVIVKGLVDPKSVTLLPHRMVVYKVFGMLGAAMVHTRMEVDASMVSEALMGIRIPLAKEAKTAVEARQQGLEALLQWLVIGKRTGGGGQGYEEAVTYLRTPINLMNGPDSQFIMGTMVQQIHPDVLESILLDLFQDTKFVKGLEGLVEAANKKHAASSSIPQVEGLLAIYFSLLHATATSKTKLSPTIEKAVAAESMSVAKTSFVFGDPTIKAIATNPVIARILPQIIALYIKISSSDGAMKSDMKPTTSLCTALSSCIAHPVAVGDNNPAVSIETAIQRMLDYQPMAEALTICLFSHVNKLALEAEKSRKALDSTRKSREEGTVPPVKGKCSENGYHNGMDVNAVRRMATRFMSFPLSPKAMGMAMILTHVGTSMRKNSRQRMAVVEKSTSNLQGCLSVRADQIEVILLVVADLIADTAGKVSPDREDLVALSPELSEAIHSASRSLMLTLGSIASNFSPASDDPDDEEMRAFVFANRLCVQELAPRFADQCTGLMPQMESLSAFAVDIFRSPLGVLCREQTSIEKVDDDKVGRGRRTEDEEWELQMKKELAKKKQAQASSNTTLSAEEKKQVDEQDKERGRISVIVDSFSRMMKAISSLAESDIQVGNSCLPILSKGILTFAVVDCPALNAIPGLKEMAVGTLEALATCVYEIEEKYAPMIATALITCYRRVEKEDGPPVTKQQRSGDLVISALPSPCESAATTIFEMDEFHDELSGASFAFLFPVIFAALKGPRTTPGCEGALRVLERHALLLAGSEKDPVVTSLRIEMVAGVLELLRHDRAQAFVDPSPYDTLVACFQTDDEPSSGPALTTAELASLLDERGALGPRNCRLASMIALGAIGTNHRKLVKGNPLIENRIWLNCFDKDEIVRREARKTWGIVHDTPGLEDGKDASLPAPSPLYAIALLPLLNHSDASIALSAASAFGWGMSAHAGSVNKNIQKLCSSYIDFCPGIAFDDTQSSTSSLSGVSLQKTLPVPAKKPVGVPASLAAKKKTVKKTALEVAGIGQPMKIKKKTSAAVKAMMKPKQERTLDQASLENHFRTGPQAPSPEKDTPEKAAARLGVLRALSALSSCDVDVDTSSLKLLSAFLLAYGIADLDEQVKNASRDTLRDLVAKYGGTDDAIAFLLPLLDQVLKGGVVDADALGDLSNDKIPDDKDASNRRKEGAVVVLGSVALHLKGPENAGKIDTTVDMLLDSLKTPSEDVQKSVADCLGKLMKKGNTQERIESILESVISRCLDGDTSSIRRGGAYGVAAAVKGSGIAALKKFGVVTKLEEACSSGSATAKEGSLYAIGLLCANLGLLFEPYVIVLLPSLLRSFSDSSDHVRKAASHTVGLIMSKLSAHGVKLVMPAVLKAFDDSAWRTKQASIRMLGSMCHLAPKQLAQALPKVVPKVIEAFADTHPKVKGSAQEALDEITTVIKNPEISSLSTVLLKALTDPADHTSTALEALIATEFLHAIDAPSLAMIVPILHRGLRDRAATTKRYGALITGNICTMINDPRDFVPYLPTLIPDLQSILLDPIPDVRSISAKALGSLTRGLGEDTMPDLRPWMIEKLRSEDVSSAERSGAAQGLTEVLIASGNETVERVILGDILPLKSHPSASTREGVLWILTFLPPALGQGFTSMMDDCLPVLISGLSDENEEVREIGMRAGRVIIRTHGRVHFGKILPILENGMRDLDHRIRLSSLMLVGDLVSMIGGTTVLRTDGDTQDDIRKAEKAQAQLTLTLGFETRNRILGEIYLARSDSAVAVRQTAVQVWKTVVSVTARTLRQILPVLVTRVVSDLASGDIEKTDVAGKCLGDIVGKLGNSVMQEIIPVLRDSLYGGDVFTRRGVCVGISEVIRSSTRDQIVQYIEIIVKVVQDGLCDDDESVRQMAATSFQNLHNVVGSRAMDEVVPALMVALQNSGNDHDRLQRALNGLTGILSLRSRELLPYIIPRLIQEPITTNHAKAIGSIAAVTGDTIIYHTKTIVPSLMNSLANSSDSASDRTQSIREALRSLCASVDESGVNQLVGTIASKCTSDKPEMRREGCWVMELLICESK